MGFVMDNEFEIKNGTLKKYKGNGKIVVIPNGVTRIAWNAFSRDMEVEEVLLQRA